MQHALTILIAVLPRWDLPRPKPFNKQNPKK